MFGVAGTSVATATVADGSFSLTFEPVSADTETVGFQEYPGNKWQITGIRLK